MTSREILTAILREKECPERMGVHGGGGPGLARGSFPPYSPVVKSHERVASRRLVP